MVLRPALVLGLVVIAVSACADRRDGTPVAVSTPASTPVTATSVAPTPTGPPPNPIDLHGVDICAVLRAAGPQRWGLVSVLTPQPRPSIVFGPADTDCSIVADHGNLSLSITAVHDRRMDDYVDGLGAPATPLRVGGYRAEVLRPSTVAATGCLGVVDVAERQFLYVQYAQTSDTDTPTHPQEELCAAVPGIAEAVLSAVERG